MLRMSGAVTPIPPHVFMASSEAASNSTASGVFNRFLKKKPTF
jgi:hypothetical protein